MWSQSHVKLLRRCNTGVFNPLDDKEDVAEYNQGNNVTTATVPDPTDLPPTCPSLYCHDNVHFFQATFSSHHLKKFTFLKLNRLVK
jgi:hypothetical protein